MAHYLFVESRSSADPSAPPSDHVAFGAGLIRRGHGVTVFLVDDGVLSARSPARRSVYADLVGEGVAVLADGESLAARGIATTELALGVVAAPLDSLVDALAEGAHAYWH